MKKLFAIIGAFFVAVFGAVVGINLLGEYDATKNREVIEVELPAEGE